MRAPRRRFFSALAVVALSPVCLAVAFLLPDDPQRLAAPITLAAVGILGLIFGGLVLAWARAAARVERSLRERRDVLGAWRVDSATWQQFVVLNRTFSTNQIRVPVEISPDGIDVIVSRLGMLVGDQVETFNSADVVNGTVRNAGGDWTVTKASVGGERPCCLYLYASMRGQHGAPVSNNIIVPLPATAIEEATRVCAYFQQQMALT